jgi:N-ethylmaleimide reductase
VTQPLLAPYQLGSLRLPNRVVMAPMTRNRADNQGNLATPLIAEYYAQRATAGLIISEGAFVSRRGIGFINVPGLYTDTQAESWQQVTAAVHAAGGRIFAQLWHVGAVSHPDLLGGSLPVAPSAINPGSNAFTHAGFKATPVPRALDVAEVADTVQDFRRATRRAVQAGFDGVELHGANGYLFQQFFARSMNARTDHYGGSVENRARFLFEVLEAVGAEMPADRIGIRLNPAMHGLSGVLLDDETLPLYRCICQRLDAGPIAYLHVMEPINDVAGLLPALTSPSVAAAIRTMYGGTLIAAVDYTQDTANAALQAGHANLVAFGRSYIANPDLVARFTADAALTAPLREFFYAGGATGYTDYPPMSGAGAAGGDRVTAGERYAESRLRSRPTIGT